MVSDRAESHEQDGEPLLKRMRFATAAGDPAMAFIPSDANGQSFARSFFGGSCRRTNSGAIRVRSKPRGKSARTINGGY
jgi:hypothetical protein